jgi:hypothetical protein
MPRIDIISTDAMPEYLNTIGLEIFRLWRQFALGHIHLGGRSIAHPTGRYAAAISFRRYGSRIGVRQPGQIPRRTINHIAIIADEDLAPEAAILETGHRGIDMLQHLQPGRFYPIHREAPTPGIVAGHYDAFPSSPYGRRRVRQMWSQTRQVGFRGFARTPSNPANRGAMNTSHTGPAWYVPPMPAYSPAQHLAELFANAKGVELTVTE